MIKTKDHIIYFVLLLIFSLVWVSALQIQIDKATIWNYLYNLIYAFMYFSGGILGVIRGFRIGKGTAAGKSLILLGSGLLSWCTGLIIWLSYNLILKVEVPYPSLADVFFIIVFYPLLTAGCLFLIKLFASHIPKRYYLDALGITAVSAALVFFFFSRPDLSQDLTFLTKLTNISYSVGDVLLLSVSMIAFRVYRGNIPLSLRIIILGLLLQAAGDITFSYRTATGVYWNGDISDILFTLAAFTLSIGILSTSSSLTPEENKKTEPLTP